MTSFQYDQLQYYSLILEVTWEKYRSYWNLSFSVYWNSTLKQEAPNKKNPQEIISRTYLEKMSKLNLKFFHTKANII